MNLLLTSCGLETEAIEARFLEMLPKDPAEIRAMFIPTAAIDPDAVEVLPKCLHDLLKCGIRRENIQVYDLHEPIEGALASRWDVVYLCGGNTEYLLKRINQGGFREQLLAFLSEGGAVLGVSAGSMIFSASLPENLGVLQCPLDVHCQEDLREKPGRYPLGRREKIRLGNRQGIAFCGDALVVFE